MATHKTHYNILNLLLSLYKYFQLVQAPSHPISCTGPSILSHGNDELDSAVNYWLANAARRESSGSETESDTDSEMTVIRNKPEETKLRTAGEPPRITELRNDG